MAAVFLMCGKIGSGKTTHAQALRREHRAAVLSVDEITLALFGQDAGADHDRYVEREERYLYQKSLELLDSGITVILDWGFWTRRERDEARAFFGSRGIPHEFHYIDVAENEWHRQLEKRNAAVRTGQTDAYFVDAGLAAKCAELFEPPDESEPDVRRF